MLGGDPAAGSHRVERFPALRGLEGSCWAEIHQFALIGLSSSLHSEACNALGASGGAIHSDTSHEHGRGRGIFEGEGEVTFTWLVLGGDPSVCSHRVEQFTALLRPATS